MLLKNKNVVVLMGGPGAEREVSLRSGAAVACALEACGALVSTLDVRDASFTLPTSTDLAFNLIHGTFGEDGQLQSILESQKIPYTGEGPEASRIAFDKILSKRRFVEHGVPTCKFEVIHRSEIIEAQPHLSALRRSCRRQKETDFANSALRRSCRQQKETDFANSALRSSLSALRSSPFVVKAPRQGSSVGIHIIKDPAAIEAALADCFQYGDEVLIEEFFVGRELTVGILGDMALPIVEIVPNDGFYDYEHKYTKGASTYYCPADLDPATTAAVQAASLAAARALGLEVYSRIDILLAPDGSLNVLEANTIPGMTATSLLPKAAAAIGISFPALCERIAALSYGRTLCPPSSISSSPL